MRTACEFFYYVNFHSQCHNYYVEEYCHSLSGSVVAKSSCDSATSRAGGVCITSAPFMPACVARISDQDYTDIIRTHP